MKMKWNLSPVETAGVVGIGLGLSWLGTAFTSGDQTTPSQRTGRVIGGTALYTAGVVIGTNRPKRGFIGKKRKKGKKKK